MKIKYYLDTSVFGGVYDEEFQDFTKLLFDKIEKENITIYYSELTENELRKAPANVKEFIRQM